MRATVKGHEKTPAQQALASAACQKKCEGRKGCFKYESGFETTSDSVTVTFTTAIYIDSTVKGSERQDIVQHETRHYTDFAALANTLQKSLQAWLKTRTTVSHDDIQNWLDWFDYDVCQASAAFHRTTGALVEICMSPNTPRPK